MSLQSITLKTALLAGGLTLLAGGALAADDACTTAQPGALPADSAEMLQKSAPGGAGRLRGLWQPAVRQPLRQFQAAA